MRRPARRSFRSSFLIAAAGTAWALAGCARAEQVNADAELRVFRCDGDINFMAWLRSEEAVISTRSHRYELQARPSSIGVRYGAGDVAFAQDEKRAVLIGAADGPYRDCVQEYPQAEA